ncbi:M48 family metallopeptidase [Bacteroidota bacterium]
MEQITVSNITIDIVRKEIKNIHLGVYPPLGRVRIAVPKTTNDDTIRLYAISKLSWIKQQQHKFAKQERQSPREYKDRESHYFQGRRYLMNIFEVDAPPRVSMRNKTYIDLHVRPGTSIVKRHEIMNEWYRNELKRMIPGLIEKWEKQMNLQVQDWRVKLMKTKWGSCNTEKKRIWLNLELAKKPVHCLEYILVHEMVHLIERHHNDRFKALMENLLPNWKQLKDELNHMPVSHADWDY